MRYIYNFLFYLALPFIFVRLLLKARKNPAYAHRWSERLGNVLPNIPTGVVWWHCVSVGETLASIPLIQLFQKNYPDIPVLVTTMTPGGSLQVENRLKNTVYHQYVPYDLAYNMLNFINRIQPRLCVLIETELWPNMIYYCHQKKIPILLANARMSEKSAKKYQRFSMLTKEILPLINIIGVQNSEDAERFIKLGYPRERLKITGSIKFDITISQELLEKAKQFKESFGFKKPIWIASSTHEGEEEIVLEAAKNIPEALLILVPRHPERRKEILNLCQKAELKTCSRSLGEIPDENTRVFLIDTLGELLLFYAISDVAFVGGSLIPKGGHNILEPAALGLPILSGASLYNFAEIEKLLDNVGGLIKVNHSDDLIIQVKSFISDLQKCERVGKAAKEVVLQNRGATMKHLQLIESLLSRNNKN